MEQKDTEIDKIMSYHGCVLGDCPHEKQEECFRALIEEGRESRDQEVARLETNLNVAQAIVIRAKSALYWYKGDRTGKEKSRWDYATFVCTDKFGGLFVDGGTVAAATLEKLDEIAKEWVE